MTCRKREVKNQKLEIRILNAHIPLPTWHFETKKIEFGPEKWKMGFKRGFSWLKCGPQFALGGWSWTVLSYRVQRKVITSDLGRSYLLPTRANARQRQISSRGNAGASETEQGQGRQEMKSHFRLRENFSRRGESVCLSHWRMRHARGLLFLPTT